MPETTVISIEEKNAIRVAKKVIQNGGIVVIPTDTLYGIACDPRNIHALNSMYIAKERPTYKAIPLLLGGMEQLRKVVRLIDPRVLRLAHVFWPGALTLVLEKQLDLPKELTPYSGVAVRMPDHPFTISLLQRTGPLAVSSANISGQANPRNLEGVLEQLDGRVDLVLDGGVIQGGNGSTIVQCLEGDIRLLRGGPIPFDQVLGVWEG
ncbi:MAG TPA: L-threonylcarbamoyladenylate synthase [Anaerolineaceae bacterium]|nr:L-threonylcarbamoyladenylate synthase [Anaerolineaceae bacterium]